MTPENETPAAEPAPEPAPRDDFELELERDLMWGWTNAGSVADRGCE